MNANQQWVAFLTEDEDDYLYWQHGFDSWANHLHLEWFATGEAFFTRPGLLQNKPTALLLDGLIPRGEEEHWLNRILNDQCCPQVSIIMLSDHFSDDQQQAYLAMGAAECMLIPTGQEELYRAVMKVNTYSG